ncbi:hypothetical protein ACEWY4_018713 [Coilia grayii]|uniref:Uncharacterized protein n=1 Tax=Coilia grayii TaxID=363190 RepID=A0ABD1JDZ6_9TELE
MRIDAVCSIPSGQQLLSAMDTSRSAAPSYLAWSIFNTFCCCLPLGIAAIIYSSRVNSANQAGDRARAESASNTTKKLNIAGLVCGIILIIVVILLRVYGGA